MSRNFFAASKALDDRKERSELADKATVPVPVFAVQSRSAMSARIWATYAEMKRRFAKQATQK